MTTTAVGEVAVLPGRASAKPAWSSRQLLLLLAITAVAAALRLHELGEWSLWVDEAHTYRDATLPLLDDPHAFVRSHRVWYPLSFLLVRGMLALGAAEHSEFWLRLPFACLGILSVPVLAVALRTFAEARVAMLTALLCALSPWHLYWSQNARGYVLVFLLAPIAAALWWQGWSRRSRIRQSIAIAVAGMASMCHPTALLLLVVFGGHATLAWLQRRGVRRVWALVLASSALVGIATLVVSWLPAAQGFLRAKSDTSLLHFVQTTGYYFRLPLLLSALAALLLQLAPGRQARDRSLFLACWLLLPFAVLFVVGGVWAKVTARYALCALPVVLMLAATVCCEFWDRLASAPGLGRLGRLAAAAALPAILAADFVAYDYLYFQVQHGDRARWREAKDHIRHVVDSEPGPAAVTVLTINEPTMVYYLRPWHWDQERAPAQQPLIEVLPITSWDIRGDARRVAEPGDRSGGDYLRHHVERCRGRARLFVVVTRPELDEQDADGSLWAVLQRDWVLSAYLPCSVGPKDENLFVFTPPAR